MKIKDQKEMEAWTLSFFSQLKEGSVVGLDGDLGAGKTQMVRWIARFLGWTGPVTSPTFDFIHTYPTDHGPLRHLDLYRLTSESEVEAIDYEEAFYPEAGWTFIEWPERALSYLPRDLIWVKIEKGPGEEREVCLCES